MYGGGVKTLVGEGGGEEKKEFGERKRGRKVEWFARERREE